MDQLRHRVAIDRAYLWRATRRGEQNDRVRAPPSGWQDKSIAGLPIGANLVSLSRTKTAKGVIYDIEATQNGWSFVLKDPGLPNSRYFLNGQPTNSSSS